MISAVIYVTAKNANRYTDRCAEYCIRRGMKLVAIVIDDRGGGRWPEVMQVLGDGEAQVIVVGDRDELPPDRTPRIDIVSEQRRQIAPDRRPRPRLLR